MRTLLPVALALAVLSISCSTTRDGPVYERGTLTRPPPAQQRPGVGAPTYDPHVKPLPPQPHPKPSRILPQTPETRREPGLWSAKEPETGSLIEDLTRLLGVQLPIPPEASSGPDRVFTATCARQMTDVLAEMGLFKLAMDMTEAQKRCMAAKLYEHCAKGLLHEITELKNTGVSYNAREFFMLGAMRKTAAAFKDVHCAPGTFDETPLFINIFNVTSMAWGTP